MRKKKMKAKQILTAIALIAAGTSAFAADTGKTRAEVQAELAQARANGSYVVGGSDYVFFTNVPTPSTKTRAEVQAELKQARTDGSLAVIDAAYPATPVVASSRSRADVRAEAIQAAKAKPTADYDIGG
jgi:hypothetical protein